MKKMSAVFEDVLDLSASRNSPSSPHPPPLPPPLHSSHPSSRAPSSASWNNFPDNSQKHRISTSHSNCTTTRDVTDFSENRTMFKADVDDTIVRNSDKLEVDSDVTSFRRNFKEDISDDVIGLHEIRNKEICGDVREAAIRRKSDDEADNYINEKRAKKVYDDDDDDDDDNKDNDDDVSTRRQQYDVTDCGVKRFIRQRSENGDDCDVKPFRRKPRNDSDRYYDDDDDDDDDDDEQSESSSSARPSRIQSLPPASVSHNSKARARRSEQSSPRSHFKSSHPSRYLSPTTTPPLPFPASLNRLHSSLNPLHPSALNSLHRAALNPLHSPALNPLLNMQLFTQLHAHADSANRARSSYEKFASAFPSGFVGNLPNHLTTADVLPYRPSYTLATSRSSTDPQQQQQQHHPQAGQKRIRREYSPGTPPLSQPSSKTTSTFPSISKQEDVDDESKQTKLYSESSEVKNSDYFEKRRKNNQAAKRSRDSRRMKEEETATKAAFLAQENIQLKAELQMWKTESAKLHQLIYERL